MGFIGRCSIFFKDRKIVEENNDFVPLRDSSLDSFVVPQRPPLINSESVEVEFQADAAGQKRRHVVEATPALAVLCRRDTNLQLCCVPTAIITSIL